MILWAVGWGIAGIARLIDGPRMMLFSAGELPFGAWQYAETILGLLIAVAVGWAGVLILRRDPRAMFATYGALGAFLLQRIIFALAGLGRMGGPAVWGDAICVAALLWFIATSLSAPDDEERRIPRVVDLALLILVGREALRLAALPSPVVSLAHDVGMLANAPVYVGLTIIGTLLGMGAAALLLARITGARIIAPTTSVLLTASLLYAFILLGTQANWQAQYAPGVATRLSLYAMGVIALIERGMLISAIEGKQRGGA